MYFSVMIDWYRPMYVWSDLIPMIVLMILCVHCILGAYNRYIVFFISEVINFFSECHIAFLHKRLKSLNIIHKLTIWTDLCKERQVFLVLIFEHQQHCYNFHFDLRHAHKNYDCRKNPETFHFLFVNEVYTKKKREFKLHASFPVEYTTIVWYVNIFCFKIE